MIGPRLSGVRLKKGTDVPDIFLSWNDSYSKTMVRGCKSVKISGRIVPDQKKESRMTDVPCIHIPLPGTDIAFLREQVEADPKRKNGQLQGGRRDGIQ